MIFLHRPYVIPVIIRVLLLLCCCCSTRPTTTLYYCCVRLVLTDGSVGVGSKIFNFFYHELRECGGDPWVTSIKGTPHKQTSVEDSSLFSLFTGIESGSDSYACAYYTVYLVHVTSGVFFSPILETSLHYDLGEVRAVLLLFPEETGRKHKHTHRGKYSYWF